MLTNKPSSRLMSAVLGAVVLGALWAPVPVRAEAIETKAREALIVDFDTGTVLLDKNGNEQMPPSSMSKLMTAVMVFDRLKEGSLSLDERFSVSQNAWRKGGAASGGSTMMLEPGQSVRVEDLLRGMIIQSGNDACIVVAENLKGSEEAFAEAMNKRAKEIGLKNSHFMNATGLPEDGHYMTPHDLATLGRYLISHFPEYFSIYSEREFTFNNIKQRNRNPLLGSMPGADGLKTGHTGVGGYGLTGTARIGERRQIMVINGLKSMQERAEEAQKLMDWGFRNFENKTLLTKGEILSTAEVWLGEDEAVPLSVDQDLRVTLPRRAAQTLDIKVVYTGPIPAPIAKGQTVAKVVINGTDMAEPIEIPLVAANSVERLGFFGRFIAAARHFIVGSKTVEAPALPAALSAPTSLLPSQIQPQPASTQGPK